MKSRTKSYLITTLGLIVTLIILNSYYFSMINFEESYGGPDFYSISKEVTLDEMIDLADEYNLSIYLPSEMPKDLKLTSIYLRNWSFLAIAVYSAEGNKDYKTAEFGIQIVPVEFTPTFDDLRTEAEESKYKIVLEINGWPVIINEKAYAGGNVETREKWGDWLSLANVWIGGVRYNFVAPTLNTDDLINVVECMSLVGL